MNYWKRPAPPKGGDYKNYKIISKLTNGRHKIAFLSHNEYDKFMIEFTSIFNKSIESIKIYKIVKDGLKFLDEKAYKDFEKMYKSSLMILISFFLFSCSDNYVQEEQETTEIVEISAQKSKLVYDILSQDMDPEYPWYILQEIIEWAEMWDYCVPDYIISLSEDYSPENLSLVMEAINEISRDSCEFGDTYAESQAWEDFCSFRVRYFEILESIN